MAFITGIIIGCFLGIVLFEGIVYAVSWYRWYQYDKNIWKGSEDYEGKE